jgi:hypothetical protein
VRADKAYDSDPLRKRLQQRGIELICPHKKNRVRPPTQDGRARALELASPGELFTIEEFSSMCAACGPKTASAN